MQRDMHLHRCWASLLVRGHHAVALVLWQELDNLLLVDEPLVSGDVPAMISVSVGGRASVDREVHESCAVTVDLL